MKNQSLLTTSCPAALRAAVVGIRLAISVGMVAMSTVSWAQAEAVTAYQQNYADRSGDDTARSKDNASAKAVEKPSRSTARNQSCAKNKDQ